jgi:CheY-like chemotaxis protein
MLHQSHQPITGTVLVADDQAANRELLEELLTAQGCKVIAVPDGAAAVEELSRTHGIRTSSIISSGWSGAARRISFLGVRPLVTRHS